MDLATALFYPYVLQQQQQPLHHHGNHNERDKSKGHFLSCSSNHCFEYIPVVVPSNDQQHNNNNKTTSRRNETYNNNNQIHKPNQQQRQYYQLSYHDMIQKIYQQHQLYLNQYCRSLLLYSNNNSNQYHHYDQKQQQPQVDVPISSSTTTTIVVAYIANNSIDYLISILAAVSSGSTGTHSDITSRTLNINHYMNVDQQQQQYDRHECCIQLLPVLIPTKWTISEIVHVLQVPSTTVNHDNNTSRHTSTTQHEHEQSHVTLIVYDSHFQSMAQQVQQQLQQQQQQQQEAVSSNHKQEKHIIQCILLPSYGHDFIMNNTNIHSSTTTRIQSNYTSNTHDNHYTNTLKNTNTSSIPSSVTSSIIHHSNVSDQDAIIVFTSGTTSGISVGVRVSHRALYIQCYMKYIHCFTNDKDTSSTTTGTGITPPPCLLASTVPLYHIGGICNYLATWYCGGTIMMPLPTIITPNQQIGHVRISLSSVTASQNISFDPSIIFQCLMYHSDSHPSLSSTSNPVNTLVVVPTMIHMLELYYIKHIQNNNGNIFPSNIIFPHVHNILVGGQSMTKTQIQFLNQIFPNVQIIQTYACTEATSSITYHNISKITKIPLNYQYTSSATSIVSTSNDAHVTNDKKTLMTIGQCVGRPPSQISVFLCKMHQEKEEENRVVGVEKSNNTNRNQNHTYTPNVQQPIIITTPYTPGIIVTSGPHIMNGYWTLRGRQNKTTVTNNNNDSHSHSNKKKNKYVITNDIGYWGEDNNLYYVGRRNTDTIRTGGETVWCTEVEQIIQQHLQIIECSVFGIPDNTYGEVVCCAIVIDSSVYSSSNTKIEMITIDTIRTWCGQKGLAGYKRPRHLLIYDKTTDQQQQTKDTTNTNTDTTSLPRNSNGKVLKYKLQQTLKELLQVQNNQHIYERTPSSNNINIVRLLSKL